jgi:hypothetical protein
VIEHWVLRPQGGSNRRPRRRSRLLLEGLVEPLVPTILIRTTPLSMNRGNPNAWNAVSSRLEPLDPWHPDPARPPRSPASVTHVAGLDPRGQLVLVRSLPSHVHKATARTPVPLRLRDACT